VARQSTSSAALMLGISKQSVGRLVRSRFQESPRSPNGQRRCVPTPQDILCRVDVGSVAVSVRDAAEGHLEDEQGRPRFLPAQKSGACARDSR
jgi:hypothetical protein